MEELVKTKVVLCDIDGTIADLTHRRHRVTDGNKEWDLFHEEAIYDEPITDVMEKVAEHNLPIILVTGRPGNYRHLTEAWLSDNLTFGYDHLLMRPAGDFRADDIIKEEIYTKAIEPYHTVEVIYDDRPRVIRMWRKLGLKVIDCGDGVEF